MTKLLGKTKQNIKKKHASARLKSFFKNESMASPAQNEESVVM